MRHELGLRFFLSAVLAVTTACGSKVAESGGESVDVGESADADVDLTDAGTGSDADASSAGDTANADAVTDETATDTGPTDAGPDSATDVPVDTGPQVDTAPDGATDGKDGGIDAESGSDVDASGMDTAPDVVPDLAPDSAIDAAPEAQDSNVAPLDADDAALGNDAPPTDAVEDSSASDSGGSDVTLSDVAEADDGDAVADESIAADANANDTTVADSDAGGPKGVPPNPCAIDTDCKSVGGVCDPLNLVCVECVVDTACPANNHCQGYKCVPFTPCTYISECAGVFLPAGQTAAWCDHFVGECAECRTSADCPASNECIAKQCVPYKPCTKSTQCPGIQICNTGAQECMDCAIDADCTDAMCLNQQCVPTVAPTTCASDTACKSLGLICDKTMGKCAQCVTDADCPAEYNCQVLKQYGVGRCVVDECVPGELQVAATGVGTKCGPNGRWTKIVAATGTCDGATAEGPLGSKCCEGYAPGSALAYAFGDGSCSCIEATAAVGGSVIKCLPATCAPGASCDKNTANACDAEGLQLLGSIACGAKESCSAGICEPWICDPGKGVSCDSTVTAVQCATDGLSTVQLTCNSAQYCSNGVCYAACIADAPMCSGAIKTKCDANGTGPDLSSGSTCTSACSNGACITCDAVNQCVLGALTWQFQPSIPLAPLDGEAYCANLLLAGYDDWRLPTTGELDGLLFKPAWSPYKVLVEPLSVTTPFDYWYMAAPVVHIGSLSYSSSVQYSSGSQYTTVSTANVDQQYVRCVRP